MQSRHLFASKEYLPVDDLNDLDHGLSDLLISDICSVSSSPATAVRSNDHPVTRSEPVFHTCCQSWLARGRCRLDNDSANQVASHPREPFTMPECQQASRLTSFDIVFDYLSKFRRRLSRVWSMNEAVGTWTCTYKPRSKIGLV